MLTNISAEVLLDHDYPRMRRSVESPFPGTKHPFYSCGLLSAGIDSPSLSSENVRKLKHYNQVTPALSSDGKSIQLK